MVNDVTVQEAMGRMTHGMVRGETYEIEAELEPGGASEIGFRLRKGQGVETVVGVDACDQHLVCRSDEVG